jgi:hypothetical protein
VGDEHQVRHMGRECQVQLLLNGIGLDEICAQLGAQRHSRKTRPKVIVRSFQLTGIASDEDDGGRAIVCPATRTTFGDRGSGANEHDVPGAERG